MNNYSRQCEKFKILMMKQIDGEITAGEKTELERHLQKCSECQDEFENLTSLREVTREMKKQLLPEMAWEEYWRHLYNRIERGVGWILISIGAIILFGIAIYHFVVDILESTQINGLEKAGILTLAIGFVVLFVSVLREKLMVRRHDKYREIQR